MSRYIFKQWIARRLCDDNSSFYVAHPMFDYNFCLTGVRLIPTQGSPEYAHLILKATQKYWELIEL